MVASAGGDRYSSLRDLAKSRVCGRGRRGGRSSRLVHRWVLGFTHTAKERERRPTCLPFYVHLYLMIIINVHFHSVIKH